MRLSSFEQKSSFSCLAIVLLLNGMFLIPPAYSQNYGDVTVKKNSDGSIETYDSSDSAAPAPRRSSRSGYKRSTQKYNDGVVVRKNADGSIETFDTGAVASSSHRSSAKNSSRSLSKYSDGVTVRKNPDGSIETFDTGSVTSSRSHSAAPHRTVSSARSKPPKSTAGSTGVHKFVHKYDKGVTVKKNPDGTIEVTGYTGVAPVASEKAQSNVKAGHSAKSSNSAKTGAVSKVRRRTAGRPKGHANYGDVKVIRNPDGSIETFDAN